MKRSSVVYVVAGNPAGPCKIGIAGSAKGRVSALQTGNPERLRVWAVVRALKPEALERAAHSVLRGHHLTGEWFSVSVGHAVATLNDLVAGKIVVPQTLLGGFYDDVSQCANGDCPHWARLTKTREKNRKAVAKHRAKAKESK